jgi:hypothetical protein
MTAETKPLPVDNAGNDELWAEYGLNYSQCSWAPGALPTSVAPSVAAKMSACLDVVCVGSLDYVTFMDERDVSLGYDPKSGGHNLAVKNEKLPVGQITVRGVAVFSQTPSVIMHHRIILQR